MPEVTKFFRAVVVGLAHLDAFEAEEGEEGDLFLSTRWTDHFGTAEVDGKRRIRSGAWSAFKIEAVYATETPSP